MSALNLIAIIISTLSAAIAISAFARVQAAAQFVEAENEASKTLSELARLSAEVTELGDAYVALMEAHRKLRSRIGMRELRARGQDNKLPDTTDPGATKRELRAELAKAGKLNAKFHQ